ncbi:HlyD family secretion protein [Bythopirellula goksoeyrii]|uniref:Inner membrane protein YiaV n=1 Tax=Bythopirellula goksoeyrii TaxID=1400387 RepID=A0A5B9Q396_9BACT|nr:biotin/lipoyl-binding protein [Bythopirellula goksoeyrii]QEG33498.1 Inner membrane protein YiaV precursor [Bythopirellula goksoeyrii]
MFLGLVITFTYIAFVWLIFFKLKLLRFTKPWIAVSVVFGLHLLLIFLIGLRFVTPYTKHAKVVQHTIQLIPRLPNPTLVTEVLVEANEPVKKGQPLFQFDRRPYQYQVDSLKAQLAQAKQNYLELKASLDAADATVAEARAKKIALQATLEAATASVAKARAEQESLKSSLDGAKASLAKAKESMAYAKEAMQISETVKEDNPGAISALRYDQAVTHLKETKAAVDLAQANVKKAETDYELEAVAEINVAVANEARARAAAGPEADAAITVAVANQTKARLEYEAQIDGENTEVAQFEAELAEAQYYLDNTTMVAPADGYLFNLQVQEGMVAGIIRVGAIASFVVDADRYVLAPYTQEQLKWVKPEQPVELAMDLYPGQIFKGTVSEVWQGSGVGQMLPSGRLPKFHPLPPEMPQTMFAVQIKLDVENESMFPIGTQGAAAIYTSQGGWAALRRIGIRAYTWGNWLYPLDL